MVKNFYSAVNREVFSDVDFSDFSRLMFDTAKGQLNGVSKQEANDKIREVMFSVLGVDETASRKELRKAIRRHKTDIFEVIEDTLDELILGGWGENPFFRQYVEIKSANFGDMNVWHAPDETILTVSELSGGHHDIIRQKIGPGKNYTVPTKWYGVKIYAEYELFMAGRVDWAGFIQKIYTAFDYKINELIYTAFDGAGSVVPNQTEFVKNGTLVRATILGLIESVQAANPGKDVVIMGTKSGLAKLEALVPVGWISNEMATERNSLGRLGIWEGAPIVELAQVFKPGTVTKVLSDSKLVIMPVDPTNKMIKVFDEGEAQIKEISDGTTNMDMTMEYEYQLKMGVGAVFMKYFGVYNITP
ncbi:MAG: hypothetical protein MJZ16_12795 [Bacteroidales bacterium]|nr:hypothetical protein [Bacteroidales bacterium]